MSLESLQLGVGWSSTESLIWFPEDCKNALRGHIAHLLNFVHLDLSLKTRLQFGSFFEPQQRIKLKEFLLLCKIFTVVAACFL